MSYNAWLSCKCCGQRIGDETSIPYGYGGTFKVQLLSDMTGEESIPVLDAVLNSDPAQYGGEEFPEEFKKHLEDLRSLAEVNKDGIWIVL